MYKKKLPYFCSAEQKLCLAQIWSELDSYVIYFTLKKNCLTLFVRDQEYSYVSTQYLEDISQYLTQNNLLDEV